MDDLGSKYKAVVTAGEGRLRQRDHRQRDEMTKNKGKESPKKKRSEESEDDEPPTLEMLMAAAAGIYEDNINNMRLEVTPRFQKLLNMANSAVLKEVILTASRTGVVPRITDFLSKDDYPQLQFESARLLASMAFKNSKYTQVGTVHVVVPIFVKLLGSSSEDVREQAVRALGNVAGESPICRDLVIAHDALCPLLALLNGVPKLSLLRTVTWTLSTFFMGWPQPVFEQIRPALLSLECLINSNDDEEVLTDACLALSHLSDCTNVEIQAILEANIFPRLVELLSHPSSSVIMPALTTVGNIAREDALQTQHIIDHETLPFLRNLLTHNEKEIKKEACWIISNITAGKEEHIQAVFDVGIIDHLVELIHTADFDIKKEAAWAIRNATCGVTFERQIRYLASKGCIHALCDLLNCQDAPVVQVCLEGLDNILRVVGEDQNY